MGAAFLALLALPVLAMAQGESAVQPDVERPVVRVAEGELRGMRIHRGPHSTIPSLYAFRGVPYARPPVGERRFKDPEEVEPWTGVKNATAYGSHCVQMGLGSNDVSGEEDCLFLNVFTADPPKYWATVNRPVMFIIHGGAFVQWRGDVEAVRPDPLLHEGIIVVTLNYRLGVMGFLNTEDSQAPGNAGLKDQVMALRWVQRNIAFFGGDPNNVTILGESAGGASVHLHMLSQLSRGLFHRAISISGSALPSWTRVEHPRRNAEALRQRFASACSHDAPDAIVSCLQRIDAKELVKNQYDVGLQKFQNYFLKCTFLPSVEEPGSGNSPFLTAQPERIIELGTFAKVPYMTGYTTSDGAVWVWFGGLTNNATRWSELDANFADIFLWEMPPGLRTREVAQRVREFYLGDRSLSDAPQNKDTMQRFVQLCTDVFIAASTVTTARTMAKEGAPVYLYQFSRDGPIAFSKEDFRMTNIPGVIHGDDMVYVYDFAKHGAEDPKPVPVSEVPLRKRQLNIFTNMIKYGNPTPEGSGFPQWPLFSAPDESYMDMGLELRVQQLARDERMTFWRRLLSSQQSSSQHNK